ncbi:hypothetical protein ACLM5J_07925 [Nocardioides sp. Bht2]|uniref:hypothetical protein n=1 Tax=Nocardioides sp. Bht2 TaxID=3392297 RepID=UPI0039B54518
MTIADADVPVPGPDTSVVTLAVGGDRTGTRTVAPLAGVQLGLFADAADATPIAQPWATCTSDADGDCSFVVPGTADGGANDGARFWVKQISAPAGWYLNESLRTGAGSGSGSVDNPYRFQTPALAAGTTYRSTSDFMFGPADSGSGQEESEGVWQQSRINPTLTDSCGLDVALVMDFSASVGSALPNLKGAADTFIDALVGTPSRVALFSFDAASPNSGADANYPQPRSVSTPAGAQAVQDTYANWVLGAGTNWDQGLWAVAQAAPRYDLVVVITDGNPTRFSADPLLGSGSTTHFRDVENGIYSANAIKAEGSRLVAVGVGNGLDEISRKNLAALSGPTMYNGADVEDADYFDADDYEEAGQAMRQLALARCEEQVAVFKEIVPPGTTGEDITGAQRAGPGWTFSATGTPGVGGLPDQKTTSDETGSVHFDLDYPAGMANAAMTISETQQDGYQLVTQAGENAVCRNRTAADAPLAVTSSGDPEEPGFTIEVPAGAFVVCTMYNRASAAIVVEKLWVVDGVEYPDGSQPAGMSAEASLTGPGAAGGSAQPWGEERNGYAQGEQVTVDETSQLPSGCTVAAAEVTEVDGDPADLPLPLETTADFPARRIQITNEVECATTLTLAKVVVNDDGGSASPEDWELSADGPSPISGVTGDPAVTAAEITAGDYDLAESGGPDGYTAGTGSAWRTGSRWPSPTDGSASSRAPTSPAPSPTTTIRIPAPGQIPAPTPEPIRTTTTTTRTTAPGACSPTPAHR